VTEYYHTVALHNTKITSLIPVYHKIFCLECIELGALLASSNSEKDPSHKMKAHCKKKQLTQPTH